MTDNTQPEALRDARWYMVDKDGMATLCTDREDAEQEAKDANMAWPHTAPYRAVQLVEVGTAAAELHRQHARIAELEAQLDSIRAGGVSGPLMGKPQEMPDISALTERGAKAWAGVDAQWLRDGVASAGSEPVATVFTMEALAPGGGVKYHATVHKPLPAGTKLYLHPSPSEGMVGGWQSIATAPRDGTRILLHPAVEVHDSWSKGHWSDQQECWLVGGSASGVIHTYWHALPPSPPTTSAGGRKG